LIDESLQEFPRAIVADVAIIARNNLQKECACVPFTPGSNAGAAVTVATHDATPVVPREKIRQA
jgi:hypothetical protein